MSTQANSIKAKAVAAIPERMNMDHVFAIESTNNPLAHNKGTDARGLGQITPIALKDYNKENPKNQFTSQDLFNPDVNRYVSAWTYNGRVPHYLNALGVQDTPNNRIWMYHDGYKNVQKGYMSDAAKDYINKYNALLSAQQAQAAQAQGAIQ